MTKRPQKPGFHAVTLSLAIILPLAGCATDGIDTMSKTTQHGYVISETALQQIPNGSSRDQVLIALGSPSTTANFGGEVFYYISQTRHRSAAFLPEYIVDQRVLAVYFDENQSVRQIANYGLKDGRVFDFVTKTTPTGGTDESFLQSVLSGALGMGRPLAK
jgi:outer membrane protein assembly factor BamE (lipoprotein component of BamABCDE complex)